MNKSDLSKREELMMKLNKIAIEYMNNYDEKIDYQEISDQMKEFSGAEYVMFNIFDKNGKDFTLVGFSGNKKHIEKASKIVGFELIGTKWDYEKERNEKFENSIITRLTSFKELMGNALPSLVTSVIEKAFNIKNITIVRITKDNRTIGNFTLLYTKDVEEVDDEMLKLFSSQVGFFIEKKELEAQMYKEREQFKTTLLSVGDSIISTDKEGNIMVMNNVAENLTKWKKEEAYGKPLEEVMKVINEHTRKPSENLAKKALEFGETVEMTNDTILITKDGEEITIEDSAAPIKDRNGNTTGAVIVFRDYTEKRNRQKQIEYLSFHDHLTGLYNRRYMEDSINRLDTNRNIPLSIIVSDVNGLKLTNDAYGHEMGDELLKVVAKILKNSCRREDIVCRVGGDEFVILLPGTNEEEMKKILKRIIAESRKTKLDSVIVSLAVGCSTKKREEKNIYEVYKEADNKMYKNKLKYGRIMRNKTIETVLLNINNKYDHEQIHTERVSRYCARIAQEMNLSSKEIEDAKIAGALHDIGKIIVAPEILNKENKLTQEESETIKKHPVTSYQILKSVDEYSHLAEAVLYHHEKLDGTGYPENLSGDEIPILSRIISVADAFEAMIANRSYQRTKSMKEAIEELKKGSGTKYDEKIVNIFINKVL